jgi:hypothetical protein
LGRRDDLPAEAVLDDDLAGAVREALDQKRTAA